MAAIVIDPSKSTLAAVLTVVIFAGVAVAAYAAVRFAILPLVRRSVERSAWHWDDILLDHKVANRLSLLAPLLVGFIGVRLASGLSAVCLSG